MNRRVVITGIGINSPLGQGLAAHTEAWKNKSHGIGPLDIVDTRDASCQFGGEISEIYKLPVPQKKLRKLVSRKDFLAVATANQAVGDAQIVDSLPDPYECGVYIGSCSTQLSDFHPYFPDVIQCINQETRFFDSSRFGSEAIQNVNPITAVKVLMNGALAHVSQIFGFKGENSNFMDFEVSGHMALDSGLKAIQEDRLKVCIVGAVTAPLDPFQLSDPHMQYDLMQTKGATLDDTMKNFQPGSDSSKGRLVSEASVFLVLESLDHAKKRGASIKGEIIDCASSSLDQSLPLSRDRYRSVNTALNSLRKKSPTLITSFNGSNHYDSTLKKSLPDDVNTITASSHLGDLLEVTALYQLLYGLGLLQENFSLPIGTSPVDGTISSLVMSRFGVSGVCTFGAEVI